MGAATCYSFFFLFCDCGYEGITWFIAVIKSERIIVCSYHFSLTETSVALPCSFSCSCSAILHQQLIHEPIVLGLMGPQASNIGGDSASSSNNGIYDCFGVHVRSI